MGVGGQVMGVGLVVGSGLGAGDGSVVGELVLFCSGVTRRRHRMEKTEMVHMERK